MRVFFAGMCLLLPLVAGASLNEAVLQEERECKAEATSYEEHRLCTVRVTPRKCRHLVRDQRPGLAMSMTWRRDWMNCINGCEEAGWYSSLFGECSTPKDPEK